MCESLHIFPSPGSVVRGSNHWVGSPILSEQTGIRKRAGDGGDIALPPPLRNAAARRSG